MTHTNTAPWHCYRVEWFYQDEERHRVRAMLVDAQSIDAAELAVLDQLAHPTEVRILAVHNLDEERQF